MKYLWKLLLIIYWGWLILVKTFVLIVYYAILIVWNLSLKEANETWEEHWGEKFFWFPISSNCLYERYYKSIPDLWNEKVWEQDLTNL